MRRFLDLLGFIGFWVYGELGFPASCVWKMLRQCIQGQTGGLFELAKLLGFIELEGLRRLATDPHPG
ncbi:hypothetical protein PITCH_A400054 [uncultured Desulfobacterium sp.]|uniref:Uncharacterized protein n=1 Tax=uncultured Desulfobacterium sp. TaxID=201089 RepID=A0A445N005_9BACT|nr:hypothetical protein PITCH_A400054 [uncultured Desulfobacterium sp.]